MANAQAAEDGSLGIIRACADPNAVSGDFFGPEGWAGFPIKLSPEEQLSEAENVRINWEGCEAAVGAFASTLTRYHGHLDSIVSSIEQR